MPMVITCECGKPLQVREELAGKRVRCPVCQKILTVPEAPRAAADDVAYRVQPAPSRPAEPRVRRARNQRCHEIDYEIIGDDLQLVEIELDPGETGIAEAGGMTYMAEAMELTAKMGDGSDPNQGFFGKLVSAGKRALTGESIFLTHFTHAGDDGKRRVAFGAPYPGKILPIDLAAMGGELICQKDAFLCAAFGTKLDIAFTKKLGAGFFGGEGFILQRLTGDGYAF